MATRILGPTGSKRRKRFLLVPILLVACTALFVVGGAQAVHDSGVFQLDGNAVATDNSTPAMPTATEDAGNICAKFAQTVTNPANPAGPFCNQPGAVSPGAATSSDRASFVSDGNGQFPSGANDDQWTNGTKDDMTIQDWVYKQAASSNDKSDIENAFAAVYTAPANAPHEAGHKLIYFGGTRTSNNGSENTAFWFLQKAVSEHPNTAAGCTLNGGCHFDGSHVAANAGADGCLTQGSLSIQMVTVGSVKAGTSPCTETDTTPDTGGDVLVVSAFSVGGTQPNTTAYEFVGLGAAPKAFCVTSKCSVLQITPVVSGCDPNFNNDPVCAITNQNIQYQTCPPASGNPPVLPPCVAGNAEPIASPWIYSEKSSDSSTSGADACTVSANHMCPGIYFEGGLDLTALGLGGECTSTFTMDTRSSGSVDASLQDLAIGQLGKCESSMTTTAAGAANSGSIGTGTVSSGIDTASVKVTNLANWGGTVKFYLCGPIAASGVCDAHGVLVNSVDFTSSTETKSVPSGDGTTTGFATLTSVGRYCWFGTFTPNAATAAAGVSGASDDGSGTTPNPECFTVSPVTPTLTTSASCSATPCILGSTLSDVAYLTGTASRPGTNGGGGDTGLYKSINATNGAAADSSITWTLYGPAANGDAQCTTTKTLSPNTATVSGDRPPPPPASNTGYGPVTYTTSVANDGLGTYTFAASYPSDSVNTNAAPDVTCANGATDGEQVTITSTASTTTTQKWLPQDTAHVTAQGGATVAGNVVFKLYESIDCTGTAVQTFGSGTATDPLIPVDANGNATTNNTTYYMDTNIQISWKATFTSTNGVASGNPAPCERSDIANLDDDITSP